MPELPEVETIKRELRPCLVGRSLEAVDINLERLVKFPDADCLRQNLPGQRVLDLQRRGKYLLWPLESGAKLVLHLGMTGQLRYLPRGNPGQPGKHTRMQIHLDDGASLRFDDSRTFGRLYLLPGADESPIAGLCRLGPEPWDRDFTPERFLELLQRRKSAIKSVLLQQEVVAGLGNIYADEALFAAGIHPARPACTLSGPEAESLHLALRQVLERAVECGGTTFRDYVRGDGSRGSFQEQLQVYGRQGQECGCCQTSLQLVRLGGRSSVYCPVCQPDHAHNPRQRQEE